MTLEESGALPQNTKLDYLQIYAEFTDTSTRIFSISFVSFRFFFSLTLWTPREIKPTDLWTRMCVCVGVKTSEGWLFIQTLIAPEAEDCCHYQLLMRQPPSLGMKAKQLKFFFIWFMWGERCKRYGICTKGLFLQSLVKGSHVIIFIYKNLKESRNPKIKTCHCLLQDVTLYLRMHFYVQLHVILNRYLSFYFIFLSVEPKRRLQRKSRLFQTG